MLANMKESINQIKSDVQTLKSEVKSLKEEKDWTQSQSTGDLILNYH